MSWQLQHTWCVGIDLLGARLATCTHCSVLRVEDDRPFVGTTFILPGYRTDRLRVAEPPCIKEPHRRAPEMPS